VHQRRPGGIPIHQDQVGKCTGTAKDGDATSASAADMWANKGTDDINPGNSIQVQAAFDVPPGTQPAELELHDSMFSGGVKLQL
jgi:hypothetical protein